MANEVPAKGVSGARVGWRFFGAELKRQRERAGLTQEALGELVFCSGSYIGQFETALRKPQLDLAQRIDARLNTDGLFEHLCEELINNSPYADYFASVAELQPLAVTLTEYSAILVPGLLQTADYARAVFQAAQPFRSPEETETRVQARMDRARALDAPKAPLLWAIMDESVLRRTVGDTSVLAAQLHHIVSLVERAKVLVQVMPYSSGAHALMEGSMTLMTFEDAPPVAYLEGPHSGQLLDDPAVVARCTASYDLARAAALPPKASLALLRSAAKEYDHEE